MSTSKKNVRGTTGTSRKSTEVLIAEGKSHKSKKELEDRARNEKAVFSGIPLKERSEVKNNPKAHKEFLNIVKILEAINKNDNTFNSIVNRYCELMAEIDDLRQQKESIKKSLELLEKKIEDTGETKLFTTQNSLNKTVMEIDKLIDSKRKMIASTENSLCLTIESASRTINTKTEEEIDPLLAALQQD